MADKRIDELEAASAVTSNDLFVLEQASTAKKLDAQTLENWLLALAQGHGGIISIEKTGSAGTDPVVDTYTITFSDTSTTTFEVTNGAKGDTGDQTYVYIKYSNRDPIADTDMTDTPSPWMGICSTTSPTAPTTYTSYTWYEIKGDKGDKGDNITISSTSVTYQEWSSGTQYPTGSWLPNPPQVTQGNYLWTRTIVNYSDGGQTVSYSVARNGLDGTGAVSSVCNQLPDNNGNVALSYADVGALPDSYQPPVTSVNEKTGTVILDNRDVKAPFSLVSSKTLSTAGWYRVLENDYSINRAATNGARSSIITFKITTSRGSGNMTEEHEIKFFQGSHDRMFAGEKSLASTLWIDKIRTTYNSSLDHTYFDIHFLGTSACNVTVRFDVAVGPNIQHAYTSGGLESVVDAPSGETVESSYTFTSDTNGDITSACSITRTAGGTASLKGVYRDGKTVYLYLEVLTSSTVNEGYNVFEGTLTAPLPLKNSICAGYTGSYIAIANILSNGQLVVRQSKGNIPQSNTYGFSFSYITP